MDEAYVGIDVAFAKAKRLPIVVCIRRAGVLEPLPLRTASVKPPAGEGNARILQGPTADEFARRTVEYLRAVESEHRVRICRVAIDAPSDPRPAGAARRRAETELDRRRISCITTPDEAEFESIRERALDHLGQGRPESSLPGANQLWMLIGFSLFRTLRPHWECLEVFPQAIASVLGVGGVHKSHAGGLEAQLRSAARRTGWPRELKARHGALVVDTSGRSDSAAATIAWTRTWRPGSHRLKKRRASRSASHRPMLFGFHDSNRLPNLSLQPTARVSSCERSTERARRG